MNRLNGNTELRVQMLNIWQQLEFEPELYLFLIVTTGWKSILKMFYSACKKQVYTCTRWVPEKNCLTWNEYDDLLTSYNKSGANLNCHSIQEETMKEGFHCKCSGRDSLQRRNVCTSCMFTLSDRDSTLPRSSMRSRCDVCSCRINSSSLFPVPAPSGGQLESLSWASRPERWTSLFANSVCSRWFWSVRFWLIRRSSANVCCNASRRSVTTLRSFSLFVSDFWSCV